MTPNEYLEEVLKSQTLSEDCQEMNDLHTHEVEVRSLLEAGFPESSPTIKPGGSKAKGTMIRDSYDLDLICYFPHEDSDPGDTLKEIYQSVVDVLKGQYEVHPKRSAIRISGKGVIGLADDFHIDVVPGRYVEGDSGDVYIHQNEGDKSWLKTNLAVHIEHIGNSGFTKAIKLLKLWNHRSGVGLKTFVLELLVIKALGGDDAPSSLSGQLEYFWGYLKDNEASLIVEDPANSGNDLAPVLTDEMKSRLASAAKQTLSSLKDGVWGVVFGPVESGKSTVRVSPATLASLAASVVKPISPWGSDHE